MCSYHEINRTPHQVLPVCSLRGKRVTLFLLPEPALSRWFRSVWKRFRPISDAASVQVALDSMSALVMSRSIGTWRWETSRQEYPFAIHPAQRQQDGVQIQLERRDVRPQVRDTRTVKA